MHFTAIDFRTLGIVIIDDELHAFLGCGSAKLLSHFLDDDSERRSVRIESDRSTVFQQLLHQVIQSADFRHDDINKGLNRLSIFQLSRQGAQSGGDSKKRIANFMCHAGNQFAYNCKSLRDDKLLREAFLFGDVFDDTEVENLAICCVGDFANTETRRHWLPRATLEIAFNIKNLTTVSQLANETISCCLVDKKILYQIYAGQLFWCPVAQHQCECRIDRHQLALWGTAIEAINCVFEDLPVTFL